jgi:uncharacterized Fe-S cluster-containing radical SAM superfamily enzyme
MAKIEFQELSFEEIKDKVRFFFLDNYYFDIDRSQLEDIGRFKAKNNSIEFDADENNARKKLNLIIAKGFEKLKNTFNNKKTVYLHKNMNIPLIGLNYIGIVDRNTSLIEVKPLTGCNLNCIYCSVDEGISSKKQVDFLVEKDFLVEELKKLIKQKKADNLEVYINPNGEPLLYRPLPELISDLSDIKEISTISLNTNGVLLTKEKVDELIRSGLSKFNISVNSIDEKTAKKMAGLNYDPEKVLDICRYIAEKGVSLVIAPVWLPGFNDDEIPKLIGFAEKIKAKIGIQNFLNYKFGRNPCKAMSFEEFFRKMKDLEGRYKIKLVYGPDDFNIKETQKTEKPFDKEDIIRAEILFEGRKKGEKVAFSESRLISVPECLKKGKIKLKIVRSKHNIFIGTLI